MAQSAPMTLDDIQREGHALYSNGTDVPASDDDDYTLRTIFINHYIREWEGTDGIKWRSLYDLKTDTYDANVDTYACPQGFRRLAGKVQIVKDGQTLKIPVFSIERLEDADLPTYYAWTSGKPGSYELNLYGVPAEWDTGQIRYRYRRWATILENPTDVPDMTHPNYLVKMLAARLHLLGRNNTQFKVNFDDAQDDLGAMITENTEGEDMEDPQTMGSRIYGGITGS